MNSKALFYIGTYTEPILHGTGDVFKGKGEGIYLASLDQETGVLQEVCLAAKTRNPSYVCVSPCGRFLYAVNELKEYEGAAQGAVSAFVIEEGGRKLRLLNEKPTGGTDPCHVAISSDGRFLVVSNFMSGSICLYAIEEDGSLAEKGQFIEHRGSGQDPLRQRGPHAHAATFDVRDEYVYVPDLGIDQVKVYRLDKAKKQLIEAGVYHAPPGSGPRYCEIATNYDMIFCVNELACTVAALKQQNGQLILLETQVMAQEGKKDGSIAAALHISPNQAYVYASLRGQDCIVSYQIGENGHLKRLVETSSGGKVPRDFILSKSGLHLLVANQNSDVVVVFAVCQKTGVLQETSRCAIPTPVCVCQLAGK